MKQTRTKINKCDKTEFNNFLNNTVILMILTDRTLNLFVTSTTI